MRATIRGLNRTHRSIPVHICRLNKHYSDSDYNTSFDHQSCFSEVCDSTSFSEVNTIFNTS